MKIGIMQGRLTPSKGRGIQFFPFEEWKQEFCAGKEIGIQEIEWIFDYERYEENPIWTETGCQEICEAMADSGIIVRSVCFDYFMRRPFYKKKGERMENLAFFSQVLQGMARIKARLIEIPLVDDSSVQNREEREKALELARDMADLARLENIVVGFETDMPPGKFTDFFEEIGRDNVAANYDSGNSSGLGYDPVEEIASLGERIANVHIKDRLLGNGTVPLGTGSADFVNVFDTLKKVGYHESFILQAARGEDGSEKATIREQMKFVEGYIATWRFGA